MTTRLFDGDDQLGTLPAHGDMARQFDHGIERYFSLNGMWRASGSPKGKDPKTWLVAANGLVSGLAAYFARLDQMAGSTDDSSEVIVYIAEDSDADDLWRVGDRFAAHILAELYARFLDFTEQPRTIREPKRPQLKVVQ